MRVKPKGWTEPTTLKDYGSLPIQERQPKQEIKVRVVKFGKQPEVYVDIREYITGGTFYKMVNGHKVFDKAKVYNGFSHKGLTLTFNQVNTLVCLLTDCLLLTEKDLLNEIQGETKET